MRRAVIVPPERTKAGVTLRRSALMSYEVQGRPCNHDRYKFTARRDSLVTCIRRTFRRSDQLPPDIWNKESSWVSGCQAANK
jgi:hypothetical protein